MTDLISLYEPSLILDGSGNVHLDEKQNKNNGGKKMKERCLIVSSLMAEHKTNYVYNMLALIKKFHANGDELVFMFPKAKTNAEWVDEIRQEGCKVYFLDYNPYSLNNVKFIKKIIILISIFWIRITSQNKSAFL